MKRFLLGVLVGLLVAGLVVVILVFAALRFGDRKIVVADGSTLVLHLEGDLPERQPVDLTLPFLEARQSLTVFDTWMMLRKAAADPRIKALVFEPRALNCGWAKLQEIHADILTFKKSGKPVYAYLRGPSAREYYLAAAADRVFMAPEDMLDLKGLRFELLYVKNTLDKLGVQMEFEHVGKYKDAPDMFTKTGSSPETREVMNQILDQFFGDLIDTIARSRKKQPEDVKRLLDDGPYVGKTALEGGLVDGLLFEDEVLTQLREQLMPGVDDGIQNPAAVVDDGYREAVAPTLRQRIFISEVERVALAVDEQTFMRVALDIDRIAGLQGRRQGRARIQPRVARQGQIETPQQGILIASREKFLGVKRPGSGLPTRQRGRDSDQRAPQAGGGSPWRPHAVRSRCAAYEVGWRRRSGPRPPRRRSRFPDWKRIHRR